MGNRLKKNVPVLRFPEFEGSWKISNIEKSCEVKNNLRKPISLPERALMQGLYPYYGPTGIIDYLDEYGLDGKFALIGEDGDHFLKYKSWSQTQLVEGKFNANNHVHIICGTKECLVEWFFVYFQHRNIIDSLTRQGAGRYKLNKASLFRLSIALPTIAEQEKIASFLGAVDTRISQLRRKHELLQTYKRGVMQKLFSQQIRFKGDDGNAFPDWEKKKLREIATRQVKKNLDESITRVLTNSAVQGVVDQQDYFDRDIANADNLGGYYIIEKGDYVYNPRISINAPVGPIHKNKCGLGVMSPLYTIFRFNTKEDAFYEQLFKTSVWHKYMCSVANYGARYDRMNITTSDFMALPLPYPISEEQQKIQQIPIKRATSLVI